MNVLVQSFAPTTQQPPKALLALKRGSCLLTQLLAMALAIAASAAAHNEAESLAPRNDNRGMQCILQNTYCNPVATRSYGMPAPLCGAALVEGRNTASSEALEPVLTWECLRRS